MDLMAKICGIEIGNTKMKTRKILINILMTIIGIGISLQESKGLNIKVQMAKMQTIHIVKRSKNDK